MIFSRYKVGIFTFDTVLTLVYKIFWCDPSNVISVVATVSSSTYLREPWTVSFQAAPPWNHFLEQDSLGEKFQIWKNWKWNFEL